MSSRGLIVDDETSIANLVPRAGEHMKFGVDVMLTRFGIVRRRRRRGPPLQSAMTIASPTAAEPGGPFRPPYDLSLDINERVSLLEQTIESADWVNAALLAAGMSQIVADYLQPDPLHLGSAIHRILGGRPSSLQRAERVVELVSDLGRFRPRTRRITAWRRTLLDLERLLAGAVVDPESVDAAAVRVAYRALRAELGTLPAPVRERSAPTRLLPLVRPRRARC